MACPQHPLQLYHQVYLSLQNLNIHDHNQKYQIHSDNSGNHIVDKFLMSGYIDDPRTVSARQIKIGKPQIDRNSSALSSQRSVFLPVSALISVVLP